MHPGTPWPAPRGDTPRRFEAVSSPSKGFGVSAILVSLALFAGLAGLAAVLPPRAMKAVVPVGFIVVIAIYGFLVAPTLRGKKAVLDVDRDRLLVDEGRGGVFALPGASLGLWRMPGTGVTLGTVLHLAGGKRPLRIGGRDHRPGAAHRLAAPPVESVDVALPAGAFEALLASVPSLATVPGHAAHGPLRVSLMPNPSSLRGGLSAMAPWLLTMALVGVVSVALGALGVLDSAAGRWVAMPLTLLIIVAGLVTTVVRSSRPRPALELELDPRELRLHDPKTGRLLAAAPLGAVSGTRGFSLFRMRSGTFTFAALVLRVPGHGDVTLGVHDTRFAWADAVPRLPAPRYVVGPPDWNAVVECFGLQRLLVVHDDHAV
ncbi:uncharacterized protein SOCEGT47_080050 [Sorangium cellulosum]|uniref:Uncharacterized protein n=1 Tax=Sorangium cellulosum TaxID=56 RepID=A0A4P2QDH1_SORCE|nr:hypothetical protein [Sorangium cellulosum]AUX27416.1 uncharacterized protein SOCEGT47_080050 [Sorangium cellulosum]